MLNVKAKCKILSSPSENILRVAVEPDGSKRADKEIFVKLCYDNIALTVIVVVILIIKVIKQT